MNKDSIMRCAEAGEPFFGRFWDTSINKMSNYTVTERDGETALVYCSGHGSYDWYYIKDYGKTWAFHLCELSEDVVRTSLGKLIKGEPKTKEIGQIEWEIDNSWSSDEYDIGYRNGLRRALEILKGDFVKAEEHGFGLAEYRQALIHSVHEAGLDDQFSDNPLETVEDIKRFISVISERLLRNMD